MKKYIKPEIETHRVDLSDCIALSDEVKQEVGGPGMWTKGENEWETEDDSGFDW